MDMENLDQTNERKLQFGNGQLQLLMLLIGHDHCRQKQSDCYFFLLSSNSRHWSLTVVQFFFLTNKNDLFDVFGVILVWRFLAWSNWPSQANNGDYRRTNCCWMINFVLGKVLINKNYNSKIIKYWSETSNNSIFSLIIAVKWSFFLFRF